MIENADTHFTDEARTTKQLLLGKLLDCPLGALPVNKLDDTVKKEERTIRFTPDAYQRLCTHPHPFDWPAGVTKISENATSPAKLPPSTHTSKADVETKVNTLIFSFHRNVAFSTRYPKTREHFLLPINPLSSSRPSPERLYLSLSPLACVIYRAISS